MPTKCGFRKQNGDRCTADPQTGKSLCVFHDPAMASEVQEARRAGGLSRTRNAAVLAPDTPDHPPENIQDVSRLLADSINQLRRGEPDPRVANGVGYLAGVLLKALENGKLEERLACLEAVVSAETRNDTEI